MKTGKASLILTAELVRAVRCESVEAIVANWGVGATTVWAWRQALGVGRVNEGTQAAMRAAGSARVDDAAIRGREAARTPEAIAKMAAAKRGRPAHPNTRAGLAAAARRAKPEGWGDQANAWMLAGRAAKRDISD